MPKAFSEEEKDEIKVRLMETALELFHDKGTKSLSIQRLTRSVGIAQGSFYSFWKDKDALVLDVIRYRSRQKLEQVMEQLPESLDDPAGFLESMIFDMAMDLMRKGESQPIYAQSFRLISRENYEEMNKVSAIYAEYVHRMAEYWREHGVIKEADEQGIVNVVTGSFVLIVNSVQFDREYFEPMLKVFIQSGIGHFMRLSERKQR